MAARTPTAIHALLADAFNRGDLDAFVAAFEPGATMIAPPHGESAVGHDKIRRAVEPIFALAPQMEIEVVGVVQGDGLAMTHARWHLVGVGDDGPVELDGRGTIVSRRQPDGTWRIVLDNPLSPG